MLALAILFGIGAVFASNAWLSGQRSLLSRNADTGPTDTIVVAATSLRFGDRLTEENLREIPWTAGARPKGSFSTRDALLKSEKGERQVLTAIEANEPVLEWKITGPGQRATLSSVLTEGMRAVSIRVNDVLGVAGFVLPGDRVDIMLTRKGKKDEQSYVDVLLQNIRVLAIDQVADDRKENPTVVRTVTLEVTTEDAQKLTLAAGVGQLSLALRQVAASEGQNTNRVTLADLVGDTPEDVAKRQAEAEAKARDEAERQKLNAQIESLQNALEKTGTRLEQRIGSVETNLKDNLNKPQPAPKPEPKEVVKEVIRYLPQPRPANVQVGVTRNLKRQVYDVPSEEAGDSASN